MSTTYAIRTPLGPAAPAESAATVLRFSPTALTAPVPGWAPREPQVVSSGLRLTRRGRLAVVLIVLATLIGGFLITAGRSVAGGPEAAPELAAVVVQPGDTLWEVATAALPDLDPREAVQRIRAVNALDVAAVRPGQTLLVPVHH